MKESNSRKSCCVRSSMKSSSAVTFLARTGSEITKASSASCTICSAQLAIRGVNVGLEAVADLHSILDAGHLTLVSGRLRSPVASALKCAPHGFSEYGLVIGICQSTVTRNCSEYVATYPLKLSQLEALIDGSIRSKKRRYPTQPNFARF